MGVLFSLHRRCTTVVPVSEANEEKTMSRKYIDCRDYPSEMNCTVALSADSEAELIAAAVQHAIAVHGHQETAEFRQQLLGVIKEGTPAP